MITYLLGLPGSGKSYYAVNKIFNNFSSHETAKKDIKVTYKNCYTNINQFKFELVNDVYELDFEKLYNILSRLHKHYKEKKSDKFLLSFLSKVKLKDTLFVIDEAHNFFDKKDLVLVWWLSYHRHLHHEIILITQNLSLIESKYKAFSEFFYVAKPQSLTLFKSFFKYNIFCSSRLSANSKSGDIKVKRSKDVFNLYHSGDSINAQNVILKFLMITAFFVSILFIFGYFIFHSLFSSDETKPTKQDIPISSPQNYDNQQTNKISQNSKINTQTSIPKSVENVSNSIFFKMTCNSYICTNENFSFPPQLLQIFIKDKQIKVLYKTNFKNKKRDFYLSTSNVFYSFIQSNNKGEKEDETKSLTSGISILGN